ncbi:hypothetical protein [Nocardioides sp. URHA0020]|uniref:hypothetical protein n=1 Tax=Nocardioides sp. URHA0020 TaxID=1380392 RepID=UPI0012DE4257|nr:hypothetical protein [Nocardioides sp. URHA0020]
MRVRRGAVAVVGAMVTIGLPAVVVTAGPAEASVKSQCKGQDKVLIRRVETASKKFVATHVEAITLARGTAFEQSVTLEHSKTLTASTNITSEVGGSANWGFASLSAKVSMTVAAEGKTTGTKTVKKTFSISEKSKDRRFVLFTGRYKVSGRWHYLSCSRAPGRGVEKYGQIKSFAGSDSGTVLCPRSRYKSSDYRYTVAVQGGC